MSTVDYAQADGRAERTNQTTITMMRQMVDYNQASWDEVLPFIEFAINSHQSEGNSVYGRHGERTETTVEFGSTSTR